jgi:hypothetical protein
MASTFRRVCLRGASADLVYDFQITGAAASSSPPLDVHHGLEQMVRTWRSAAHWTIVVAHDGARLSAHIVVRRHTATGRFDNAFLAFQRQLTTLLSNSVVPQRRTWTAVEGSAARVYADVKVAIEPYHETCTTAKALARSFAGPRGTVSVSSDWSPLPPVDSTSKPSAPA